MNQIVLTETRKRPSRDEMNLAEFPLTVLSTRVSSGVKTLEFSDSVKGKSGEVVRRHWIVTGADKFGLPTASDDEVLLGLIKLTVHGGFQERKIYFTRYELLKTLRWTTEGRSYQRLQNALDRLSGVRIKATNAFYDNEAKAHSTRNFGILDAYEINHAGESQAKPSFFIWSEVLFKSFQAGFIKKLDLDFYLSLKSAVSKRLYRYLDKHFWYKSRVQVGLFTLAHEKIGISRNYRFASSIRQQLDPAIEELMAVGFLSRCEYMGRGAETEVVLYAAAKAPRALERRESAAQLQDEVFQAASTDQKDSVDGQRSVRRLLEDRGLRAAQVTKLLAEADEKRLERIRQIVEHFDNLCAGGSRLVSKSPVGFLYRAIERPEDFVLPGETSQTGFGFAPRAPTEQTGQGSGTDKGKAQKQLEALYLVARKKEIRRLLDEVEPAVLERIKSDVRKALANLEGLISEPRFEEAVEHGVEERLLKLFAFPEISEWAKRNVH